MPNENTTPPLSADTSVRRLERKIAAPTHAPEAGHHRLEHAKNGLTERRRSRTDRAWGYHTAQVLKTRWATGPMPLRDRGYRRRG